MTSTPKPSTVTGGYKVTVDPRELAGIRAISFQSQTERGCTFSTSGGPLSIAFFAHGVIRLMLGDAVYPDYGLLVQEAQPVEVDVQKTDAAVTLMCGQDTVRVQLDPFCLEISRAGQLRIQSSRELHMGGGPRVPLLLREEKNGQQWSGLSLELGPGEPMYGLGEKFGRLNKRGERVISWNEDAYGVSGEYAYKNVPFAWSPQGWGLLVHTPTRVVHGVGYSEWSQRSYCLLSQEKQLDLFFFLGESPAELLSHYANLTGSAPEVPRWSLGIWMSRAFYRTADEAMSVARELRERKLPCDVFTLDGRAWLDVDTRCTLDFDERYPDPAGWIAELKTMHYKLCVWEYPLISVRNALYAELAEKGYFLTDKNGAPYIYHWDPAPFGQLLTPLPESGLIDFTNPDAYEWYQANHDKLWAVGVDVMKTDFAEQVPEDAYAMNGDSGIRHHNVYALLYNKAVYEATAAHAPSGALVWGRAGWIGSQRYALGWGGDPQTDWGGLAASLRGGLSWGLSGTPYHSHDIGGFYGPPPSPELYIRWSQLGMLGSHARFHGTTPREPWFFGEEAERIVRSWMNLRYKLLPYLERLCSEAARHNKPVSRAMVYACPDEPQSWAFEEQYLLGDALLVAPVLQPGGQVRVYLPAGRWQHLFTGEWFEGGRVYNLTAPLEWIPVFGREGTELPLGPAMQHTGESDSGVVQVLRFDDSSAGLNLLGE